MNNKSITLYQNKSIEKSDFNIKEEKNFDIDEEDMLRKKELKIYKKLQ